MTIPIDDAHLAESLSNGSIEAFNQLYYSYHKVVFANIFKLVKRQQEAEELLQDVFVALWENRSKINSAQAVAGWLAVVSHNKAINHLNRSIKTVLVANDISPLEVADFPEVDESLFDFQLGLLIEAIEKLSDSKKAAFTLCKLQGKTYAEAAAILGISPNTVKAHIVLATKFVKTYVIGKYPLPDTRIAPVLSLLLTSPLVTIA